MSKHAFAEAGGFDACPFLPVFGPPAVMFSRGAGTELWDTSGKRYLDFLCGLAVTSLGHAHPAVADALCSQSQTLLHVSNFFANEQAWNAAVELNALLEDATGCKGQVFFCNSGAEANEAAIKLARKFGGRGRHVMVSALGSFHGRTLGALAATGQPAKHEPFQPMPEGFRHVTFGDIEALSAAVDSTVAAVLLEPIQGEGGVIPAPDGYLAAVERLCRERGVLLILDEVQTGMARTGEWFGFQHHGITPDAVLMAKALGNGVPVGAIWTKREVGSVFAPGDHGSTYSGTALVASVVRAVIAEMRKIDAPRLATDTGAYLRSKIEAVPGVTSVRGAGLLLGAELVAGVDSGAVYRACLADGLVINAVNATTIRMAPPLNVSRAHVDEAVTIFAGALARVQKESAT
ncbi:MAG: acetylornithine/succinylornithine family transaminase [Actinobacteria bacterium]|nr:acetylornithine/succinylornithine family transaminase [Actinomycetota bacterium]NBP54018.1 acetylornithine/succinylornithine family transaminase [Actinomycetota bacterium]